MDRVSGVMFATACPSTMVEEAWAALGAAAAAAVTSGSEETSC